jgi:hypothetical protein
MSQETMMGFGYFDDADESLKSKSGGVFGLNTSVFLTKFELNPNAGADGAAQDAIDITIQIEDREFRNRIYPTTKVYDKDGNELTDKTSSEYIKAYNADWKQKNAVITHILKCFRTEDEIKQALSTPLNSFADFARVVTGLLPVDSEKKPLDVFLEYQWTIGSGQDRTYLQLPRNMKGGYWICDSVQANGTWTKIVDDKGLRYVDVQDNEHPFTRDKNFMSGNKANQQIEGEEASNAALESAASSASDGKW